MESLFVRQTPRRGRVVLMLTGSLLVHGGLVGIGALLVQPAPKEVLVEWLQPQEEGPVLLKVTDSAEQPTIDEAGPTATPEVIDVVVTPPPPIIDDPVFAEPSSPTPQQRPVAKPTMTKRMDGVRTTSSTSDSPGSGVPGGKNNNPVAGGLSWLMPHPPYPAVARRLVSASGLTTVRITTDATGHISSVVVIRSTGNPILDAHTISYVRENWRGPANASRTTEFLYQVR